MPPKKSCGCGLSCFGASANSFFVPLQDPAPCLQNGLYYQNNQAPLTLASGFGKKRAMKIGKKK
jgi:hypothetical protein